MGERAAGEIVAERYRLEQEIARGGMGSVWRALHVELGSAVAIKFMDPALGVNEVARERFAREARAAARVQSPHVVHISDHGIHHDTPYIVMELLEGEDLDTRLLRGPMSFDQAERVMTQAAAGLRKMHETGVVHRDLKPSNLFLAGDEDEWMIKIVDFGVAKTVGTAALPATPSSPGSRPGFAAPISSPGRDEFTQTGVVMGSPQYMSPEQARGFKSVDHRADLWALSTIMFRVLTGRRVFEGLSAMEALTRLVYDPLPSVDELAPELPAAIRDFFRRALAHDVGERFDNARALSDAFRAAIEAAKTQRDEGSIGGATVPRQHEPPPSLHDQQPAPRAQVSWLPLAVGGTVVAGVLGAIVVATVVKAETAAPPLRPGLLPAGLVQGAMRAAGDVRRHQDGVEGVIIDDGRDADGGEDDELEAGEGGGDGAGGEAPEPPAPNKPPKRVWGF